MPREEGQPGPSHTRVPHAELGLPNPVLLVTQTGCCMEGWRGCSLPYLSLPSGVFLIVLKYTEHKIYHLNHFRYTVQWY